MVHVYQWLLGLTKGFFKVDVTFWAAPPLMTDFTNMPLFWGLSQPSSSWALDLPLTLTPKPAAPLTLRGIFNFRTSFPSFRSWAVLSSFTYKYNQLFVKVTVHCKINGFQICTASVVSLIAYSCNHNHTPLIIGTPSPHRIGHENKPFPHFFSLWNTPNRRDSLRFYNSKAQRDLDTTNF